jgi:hypothetical protein
MATPRCSSRHREGLLGYSDVVRFRQRPWTSTSIALLVLACTATSSRDSPDGQAPRLPDGGGGSGGEAPIDCSLIDCLPVECEPGAVTETPPYECCPVCRAPSMDLAACSAAQDSLLPALVDALGDAAFACTDDDDCVLTSLSSRCALDCGTAVHADYAVAVREFAVTHGDEQCMGCPEIDHVCPPFVPTVSCLDGACIAQ